MKASVSSSIAALFLFVHSASAIELIDWESLEKNMEVLLIGMGFSDHQINRLRKLECTDPELALLEQTLLVTGFRYQIDLHVQKDLANEWTQAKVLATMTATEEETKRYRKKIEDLREKLLKKSTFQFDASGTNDELVAQVRHFYREWGQTMKIRRRILDSVDRQFQAEYLGDRQSVLRDIVRAFRFESEYEMDRHMAAEATRMAERLGHICRTRQAESARDARTNLNTKDLNPAETKTKPVGTQKTPDSIQDSSLNGG